MASKKDNGFTLIGNDKPTCYGVFARYDPKTHVLDLRLHLDDAAIKKAPVSSTGKSKLVGNTSGFTGFEFGEHKLNLNVCATVKV